MVELVRILLRLAAVYGALGLVFAGAFHSLALPSLDAGTRGAGIGFRMLITPGIVALWPLLALRWWRARHGAPFLGEPDRPIAPHRLRRVHALSWNALAVLVPLVVGVGLAWRPAEPPKARSLGLSPSLDATQQVKSTPTTGGENSSLTHEADRTSRK